MAHFPAFGFEQGRSVCDSHGFGRLAYFEPDVPASVSGDHYFHIFLHELFESGHIH